MLCDMVLYIKITLSCLCWHARIKWADVLVVIHDPIFIDFALLEIILLTYLPFHNPETSTAKMPALICLFVTITVK